MLLMLFTILTSLLALSTVPSLGKLEMVDESVKADGSLSILVVGDWGRKGSHNQSQVAFQMGIIGEERKADFVISTGDNFYTDGLTGVDDPAFYDSFTNIYTAKSLQKRWYSVLGNHDYRGDVEAQLSPILTDLDSRWFCKRSFVVRTEIADIVFVETTPLVDIYFDDPKGKTYDWRGVLPREAYISDLLEDVDLALKDAVGKWKVVVGHHTIKSAGHHGMTEEVERELLPILLENNVDLYLNGHDHCLERISSVDSALQFLTSGGGSKAWRGDISWMNPRELKFYYDGQGFMSLQLTMRDIQVVFYDAFGRIRHQWNRVSGFIYDTV